MSRLVGSRSCAIFQSSFDRNSFLRFHLCTQDPPTIRGAHASRAACRIYRSVIACALLQLHARYTRASALSCATP